MNNTDTYWAAQSGLDLAEAAAEKVSDFYSELTNSVIYQRWTKAYRTFYGLPSHEDPFDISRVGLAGKEGELTSLKLNHAGSLAQHIVSLVSQTVPEFECVPTNSDYESLSQALFGEKILDYYMDVEEVGQHLYDTALSGAVFGIGYLAVEWDPNSGPPLTQIDPLLPGRTKAGELQFRVFTPLDVICDRFRYDQDHDWVITRRWVNRWDLIARYQAYAQEILDLHVSDDNRLPAENRIDEERGRQERNDLVPLYTLYHRKSDALPNGKLAMFLSDNILLLESNLPYQETPLVSICPRKMLRTPHGDSTFHQLLACQDVLDNLLSAVASNNVALATNFVLVPSNVSYSPAELGQGLAVLEYEAGPNGALKPEALNLNAPNGEALRFAETLKQHMEEISGINSTVRGSPPPNVDSGAFGALIATQALSYSTAFQYSFQQAVARTGNLIISILQQYADQPIVAEIAGEANRYQTAEFSKAKLERIHRVTVRSGNPASRTAAFQLSMADSLLQKNLIDAKGYVLLVKTGNLDQEVESDEAEQLNIRRENELIRNGRKPTMIAIDNHAQHIASHKNAIGDPSARDNPAVVSVGLAHIQEHIQALQTVDPILLQATGQQPLPPPGPPPGAAPPGAPDQGPGGPPGPNQPPVGTGSKLPPTPQPPNVGGPGQLPNMPQMPTNPITGQPYNPTDGGVQA